jgi:hypothetical protein
VIVTGSTVSGNTAADDGGGIHNAGVVGSLTLVDSTVTGNLATFGGGIRNFAALILTGSTVSGNTATDDGGGIFNDGDTMTLDATSRVTGNTADPTDPDSGGGIFNDGGTVTLANAANVSGNTPDNCGGDAVPLCAG